MPTRDRLLWAVLVGLVGDLAAFLMGVKVVGLMMGLAVGLANVLTVPVDLVARSCWPPSRAS